MALLSPLRLIFFAPPPLSFYWAATPTLSMLLVNPTRTKATTRVVRSYFPFLREKPCLSLTKKLKAYLETLLKTNLAHPGPQWPAPFPAFDSVFSHTDFPSFSLILSPHCVCANYLPRFVLRVFQAQCFPTIRCPISWCPGK